MNLSTKIKQEWIQIHNKMLKMSPFARLASGDLKVDHYKSVMRQTYLQTRDNPQVQAAVTMKIQGPAREMIRKMMGHSLAEVGHDQLALADLFALGEDIKDLASMRPLPGTASLMAFSYHAGMHMRPAVYYGYLYFLESMPVHSGQAHLERLKKLGIPEAAMTFIEEHAAFDVGHMKLNEEYISALVTDEQSFQDFVFGMRTTATLYGRMLEDAFAAADEGISCYDINPSEADATFSFLEKNLKKERA